MRVPRQEPAREDGRLKALFDDQDRCVCIPAAGVSVQVLLGRRKGALLLCGIGLSPNPQEHLCGRGGILMRVYQGLRTRPDPLPFLSPSANHSLRELSRPHLLSREKGFPRISLVF